MDERFLRGAMGAVRQMLSGSQDRAILEIAVGLGLVPPERAAECLAELGTRSGIGEILLRRRCVDEAGLQRILAEHRRRSEGIPDIPRYELIERIGEGAASVVYRGRDRQLGRPVAVKLLREDAGLGDEARRRFEQEARAAASLSHPNLVSVFDAGEADGRMYIVMELIEGRPLSALIRDGAPDMVRILEEAAWGIASAHAQGIVHRDLKPANILVTAAGRPKVGDFGLARWVEARSALTRAGSAVGTPLYMAPEQVRGGEVTPGTDVYALGAILYEILTGRPPHRGENEPQLFERILRDDPIPPRSVNAGAPADLQAVCLKALDKEPSGRYADASGFAEDLRRHRLGEPVSARPRGAAAKMWRKIRRVRAAAGLIALGAAGALVVALVLGGGDDAGRRMPSIRTKSDRVSSGIRRWQREGRDPSGLAELVRQANDHLGAGRLGEAEAALDRALALLGPEPPLDPAKRAQLARSLEDLNREIAEWDKALGPCPAAPAAAKAQAMLSAGALVEAEEAIEAARLQMLVVKKQSRLQQAVERARGLGRDLSGAIPLIEQFHRMMEAGNLRGAEAAVTRALAVLALQDKMQRVQDAIGSWQREGRDPSAVGEILRDLDPLMKQERLGEAEALLDRALEMLQRH